MSQWGGGCTLIILSAGAPARAYVLPRRWHLWLGLVGALSLCMSLYAGRKARALFHGEAERSAWAGHPPVLAGHPPMPSVRERFASFASFSPRGEPAGDGRLRLFDVNRERALAVSPFTPEGHARADAFAALRAFMGCRRTGHTLDMHPGLIALLLRISDHFGAATLHVVSAHRAVDGVVTSSASQHARGTAADIRVPGVPVETLAATARELGARGVGAYFRNQFVHVDVRERAYYWREAARVEAAASAESGERAAGEADGPAAEEAGELDGEDGEALEAEEALDEEGVIEAEGTRSGAPEAEAAP